MKKQKHGDQKVEIFSASETVPEKKSGVPILLLIVFLILAAGAAAGFSYIRTLHTAQCDDKYKKDASETVGKLEEFHARTGTGGNLAGYSEEVGRLNAVIKTFKEKYQAQPEAVYVSYWAIISAGDCYNSAKEEWNHSKQPEFESNPRKEKISRSWSIASDYIKLAKACIPEEGREKPRNSERKKELSALADKQMDMVSQDLAALKSGDSSGASPTPSPSPVTGSPLPSPSNKPATPNAENSGTPKVPGTPRPTKTPIHTATPASAENPPYTLQGIFTSGGVKMAILQGKTPGASGICKVKAGDCVPGSWTVSSIGEKSVVLKKNRVVKTLQLNSSKKPRRTRR